MPRQNLVTQDLLAGVGGLKFMFSETHRQKLREAYQRRMARGDIFGFQKKHKLFRGSVSEDEKKKRLETRKLNFVRKPYPQCPTCGKELDKWRYKSCREHMEWSFQKGKPGPKGKTWKLKLTPEQKVIRSERAKHQNWSEQSRQKMREYRLNHPQLRYKDTDIELLIEEALKQKGITYEKQVSLFGVARVDFYLPQLKIVIQCDGCYWHNCPTHYPLYNQSQSKKDKQKDIALSENEITVLRFWEHDIKRSPEECLASIK